MLYPQLLDRDFEKLPRSLRQFHTAPGGGSASGTVAVERFRGWLATLIGFPPAGDRIPIELRVIADDTREIWIRRFGTTERRTVQRRQGALLLESAGPVRFCFRLVSEPSGMRFELCSARFWIVPLPLRIEARAWGDDSSWEFHVTIAGIGSYRGTMVPNV